VAVRAFVGSARPSVSSDAPGHFGHPSIAV
jgi:hypothetical protein